jgi:hypothetical protein
MPQVLLLHDLSPTKVFILFDSNEEAQKSADRLARKIWFSEVEITELKGAEDPGDLSILEAQQLMTELLLTEGRERK